VSVILTHTGKLGDFAYALQIGSWIFRSHGNRIHWVLTKRFLPFTKIESLLCAQEMTERVTLVDFPVDHWRRGGQPYKFNPAWFGIEGKYYNLGFRNFPQRKWGIIRQDLPDKYVSEYMAEEHGLGVDYGFKPNLGHVDQHGLRVCTEQLVGYLDYPTYDSNASVLSNLQFMAGASERHCFYSGMASLLYVCGLPIVLYRTWKNPPTNTYFPNKQLRKVKWLRRSQITIPSGG